MEVLVENSLPDGVTSIEQFMFLADRVQAGKYLTLAVFCLLVLEYLQTLDEEVMYIWKTRPLLVWTKALFVIVRYFPLIVSAVRLYVVVAPDITPDACNTGVTFTQWAGVVSAVAIEILLMLRVWALYRRSRTILIFFSIVVVLGVAGGLAVLQLNFPVPPFLATVAPPSMTACAHGNPVQDPLLYAILLLVELTIFVLLIRRTYFALGPRGAAPIVSALVNHGAIYFLCVTFCLVLAGIAPFTHALAQPMMDSELTVTIGAAACVRLIFSLRGAQVDRQAEGDEVITGASIKITPPTTMPYASDHIPLSPLSPNAGLSQISSKPYSNPDWDRNVRWA